MLMSAAQSCLLVVDMQARLVPTMATPQAVVDNTRVLIEAAKRLHVPRLVSEQYPRGLGPTVLEIAALVPADRTLKKMHFSCIGDADFAGRFREIGDARQSSPVSRRTSVCCRPPRICSPQASIPSSSPMPPRRARSRTTRRRWRG